ncbi:PREDICTED: LOW QUALITY PROTEIN: APC membrane recruitment protein 3 [Dipodomys ordii]|uniref:LOW QUALITY PROTEIN: APC membrane recruitment protein 3 n=1 Tax=Dipodomys ordii TaxID=10020 RepID=A0A1S3FJR3_DIPOR|nr:PREDICTED: LOW QUALITY PROTEIN: APC membrane recruitment protein 3 [Dipodomys ordii]
MELKRGKTFIKSSFSTNLPMHISHEKHSDLVATAVAREDADSWSISLRGQQRPCSEKGSQASPGTQRYTRCPNKGAQPDSEDSSIALCGTTFKLVRKSKTHDSVPEAGKAATDTGQLVGSVSFSGSPSGQRMIDYRHFVPQMPFVPAVAKSIPRKRISLKRPKKCFRNLFHIRRSKTENLASLTAKEKSLFSPGVSSDVTGQQGKAFLSLGEGLGLDTLCQDLSDSELLPDSPFDLCSALCEDVASLKSFDSLTGCGEIFADESSVPSLELSGGPEGSAWAPRAPESKSPRGPFQGSVEQLASPAQNEASDFTKFWDSVNRSVRRQQRALLGSWLVGPQGTDTEQPKLDVAGLAELPLFPCRGPPNDSKASSIDTGTPKSEQPESVSTSDEGYYDSFSPGLEEDKKETPSPGTPAVTFPRDSYSGDALYELFSDPSDGPVGPSLDDDLCVSESLSGPAVGTPLSMCSFHVGAEENLAPAPGPDLLSQSFLQSSWRGKECLLKLCDTELSITMGIVNWLRRTPPAPPPGEAVARPGPHGAPKGTAGKPESSKDQASGASRATVCSAPNRQELWACPGKTGGQEITVASKDLFLEEETRGCPNSSFSPEGSAVSTTNISSKSKVQSPPTRPGSQKEPGPPENLRHPQDPQWPGHGGSTPDAGPMLAGCVESVTGLQISLDGRSPRQDMGDRLFRQPQDCGPNVLHQKQGATTCGQPSLATRQDQRYPDLFLELSQLKLEPSRMDSQAFTSVENQPLELSPRAMEQVGHRGQLDPKPLSAPDAQWSPWGFPPEILGLTLGSHH